jgi:rod shape-determining protein MreD
VRRRWLAPVVLAAALLFQLTVLNGVHLPGGGVPDLVLILVVALAMIDGPMAGLGIGFAAGLSVDLAPPGSGLVGQYALVFCVAGWAAGRLAGTVSRSPLRALAVAAAVTAAAEAVTAGLARVLEPAQVTVADIRQFLPYSIAYDLLLCPFVLYLVVVASSALAPSALASARLAGAGAGRSGLQTGLAQSKRAARKRRPHEPRLGPAAGRAGDGWVGGSAASRTGGRMPARRPARLHPGAGVAGSASGFARPHRLPAGSATFSPTARRRGDGAIGNLVGRGQGDHWQPSRHPGSLAGGTARFRPHGGEISGSAARQHAPAGLGLTRARINFGAHRGAGIAGRRAGASWLSRPVSRPGLGLTRARINFGAHQGPWSAGRRPGGSWLSRPAGGVGGRPGGSWLSRPGSRPGPRLRMGASRSAFSLAGRGLSAGVPKVQFRTAAPRVARRAAAAPKFRRGSRLRPSGLTTGLVAGGVLDNTTFRAHRRSVGLPRLRLAGRRNGGGTLGGSARSALRRPPARSRRQPQFGYGRRSLLSFLTGRRIGGRWLASKRVGSRSGVWVISRRTGGAR